MTDSTLGLTKCETCLKPRTNASVTGRDKQEKRFVWSALQGRVSTRLARHFLAAPHRLPAHAPVVSFTFDDAPDSAAGEGAALLEEHGGRGTFYLAGSLIGQPGDHWSSLTNDAIVRLHQ